MKTRPINDVIAEYVAQFLEREAAQLEWDCATALALQDYDKIDRLQVVYVDHQPRWDFDTDPVTVHCIPPAVASAVQS